MIWNLTWNSHCLLYFLAIAAEDRLQTFRNLFTSAASYCMAERHLWFSIFNRPAHNRFTRVQRLTCCVTLLYTFMWVHVMWYGLLKQKNDVNQDVAFSFSWEEVVVSIVSNFTLFPISLGLIYLFKKSRSRVRNERIWQWRYILQTNTPGLMIKYRFNLANVVFSICFTIKSSIHAL